MADPRRRIARQPDFEQFLKVLRRQGRPDHLPFYEHGYSLGFFAARTGKDFRATGVAHPDFWPSYVDFWVGMGYDCIPMEVGLNCPLTSAPRPEGTVSAESEAHVCIRSMEDFENYPWPDESRPIEFGHFEAVSRLLPEGMKIVAGVGAGPYEWATLMMGVVGLSTALFDNPELVAAVFRKLGSLHVSGVRQLSTMEAVGALRQGDDLGFKTATFLKPADLRRLVFPIYRRMIAQAHANGKPFILHSCGDLQQVYPDLRVRP